MATLFGKPPTMTPQAPAKMPDPEDPSVVEAKRKAVADALTRGGRTSTILTGKNGSASPALGDNYSGAKLG